MSTDGHVREEQLARRIHAMLVRERVGVVGQSYQISDKINFPPHVRSPDSRDNYGEPLKENVEQSLKSEACLILRPSILQCLKKSPNIRQGFLLPLLSAFAQGREGWWVVPFPALRAAADLC